MMRHPVPIDWSKVKEADVKEACSLYDRSDRLPKRAAKNTFLLFGGTRYPAKFIRGLAYEIATGHKLSSGDYSGGTETVRFFRALGFSVEYNGKVSDEIYNHESDQKREDRIPDTDTKEEKSSSRRKKNIFLQKLLEQRFGCVMTEAKFDWLVAPDYISMDDVLREIYDNLKAMRNYSGFSNPGYKLACDFFIPTKNVIIEYDERQHFTEQRAKSLAYYPSNLNLRFDKDKWREACENIKATDNDPIYRDEQRAFYDSVRDISAARNGVPLIRIKHGDYDWESKSGTKVIDELINLRKLNTHALDLEGTIEELAWDFSCVQKAYHDWAKQFDNHNEVINWLKEHGIDVSRCRKQDPFKLHSSDWNSITVPTLYKLVPYCMAWMEDIFDKWFQNLSEAQIARDTIWYLLFFIHPVRHELYYFDIHYPDGYSSRLARSIRSHRLGLKGAKKYLRCLFSWEKIPGNDTGRLIEYLMQNFNIEWVKAAKIKKNDDGKTIRITSETNSLSLTLNDEKTNVNLEIDDGRTDKFIVKTEFGGLNIFSRDGRTTDDSYIRACGTTAFKHIHLHPTTSNWKKPNLQDLKEASIRHLGIGEGDLSPDEQKIAIALSARATPSFGLWINYAQCAINEGPIFTLKKNKRHSDCFNELVGILQGTDQNQKDIRNKLEEYYNIEVIIDTK